MARMRLLRLPTEKELEDISIEPSAFLEAFSNKSISGFTAEVEDKGDGIVLDGWDIPTADWFNVEN